MTLSCCFVTTWFSLVRSKSRWLCAVPPAWFSNCAIAFSMTEVGPTVPSTAVPGYSTSLSFVPISINLPQPYIHMLMSIVR